MRLAVRHQVSIALGNGVSRAALHLLMTPRSIATQQVHEWTLVVDGIEETAAFRDACGNDTMLVTRSRPGPELLISAAGVVETLDRAGVVGRIEGEPAAILFTRRTAGAEASPAIYDKFRGASKNGGARIGLFHDIMDRMAEVYDYADAEPGAVLSQSQTSNGQAQSQSVAKPRLVARDFASGFVGAVRALDLPARYVSGYLLGCRAPHAWAEAWDDDLGWIAFDPALGLCPTEQHIRVAVGLDATTTPPVRSVPVAGEPAVLGLSVSAA